MRKQKANWAKVSVYITVGIFVITSIASLWNFFNDLSLEQKDTQIRELSKEKDELQLLGKDQKEKYEKVVEDLKQQNLITSARLDSANQYLMRLNQQPAFAFTYPIIKNGKATVPADELIYLMRIHYSADTLIKALENELSAEHKLIHYQNEIIRLQESQVRTFEALNDNQNKIIEQLNGTHSSDTGQWINVLPVIIVILFAIVLFMVKPFRKEISSWVRKG